jgi:hypothetical protein
MSIFGFPTNEAVLFRRFGLKLNLKNKWILSAASALFLVLALGAAALHDRALKSMTSTALGADAAAVELPLFAPEDKPLKINLKGLDLRTGKWADFPVTIRQSKSRLNQIKQAVLAFVAQGNRLDIPAGLTVNEVYFTPQEGAVVDVSTANLTAGSMGFYEELLFIRGLIETLTKNFSEVRQIKLLVNGLDAPTLAGHYALGTTETATTASATTNSTEDVYGNQ